MTTPPETTPNTGSMRATIRELLGEKAMGAIGCTEDVSLDLCLVRICREVLMSKADAAEEKKRADAWRKLAIEREKEIAKLRYMDRPVKKGRTT